VDHGLDMLGVFTTAENVESGKGLMHKQSSAWWLSTWPGGPLPKWASSMDSPKAVCFDWSDWPASPYGIRG
jgi:hypothetical protein